MDEKFPGRRTYIGCSELSAMLGLAPKTWRIGTPFALWQAKKLGIQRPVSPEEQTWLDAGNSIEPYILERYEETLGVRGLKLRDRQVEVESDDRLVRGHLDASASVAIVSTGKDSESIVVDAKNVRFRDPTKWGEAWSSDFPVHYKIQLWGYLELTGFDVAHLAVLFSGCELVIYELRPDPERQAAIMDAARAWWDRYIVGDETPAPTAPAEFRAAFGDPREDAYLAEGDDLATLQRISEIHQTIEDLKRLKADASSAIMQRMAGRARCVDASGRTLATWNGKSFLPKYSQLRKANR